MASSLLASGGYLIQQYASAGPHPPFYGVIIYDRFYDDGGTWVWKPDLPALPASAVPGLSVETIRPGAAGRGGRLPAVMMGDGAIPITAPGCSGAPCTGATLHEATGWLVVGREGPYHFDMLLDPPAPVRCAAEVRFGNHRDRTARRGLTAISVGPPVHSLPERSVEAGGALLQTGVYRIAWRFACVGRHPDRVWPRMARGEGPYRTLLPGRDLFSDPPS
ncbi:MAG TPA: hypothetical protein VED40_16655 [Azospirillaceae bacterium]|nr:hypothetical protein [Azospirillaceae bacterium]